MNIIARSFAQPTGQQFDVDARCRWDGEGGSQRLPFDRGSPESGSGWPLRIGIVGMLKRMAASCTSALDWLVSSNGRFASDTREMFGIPQVDQGARFHKG